MKSAVFYKFLSVVLALLLALGSAYAAKLIHDAQFDVDKFQKSQDDAQAELASQTLELNKQKEFLARLQNDPDFLERIARERLIYAKPDETIYRFDVDPLTGASDQANLDSLSSRYAAPPASSSRRSSP
jgi:cell division protein FtsB